VKTLMVDDLDGSPAADTVRFGIDGCSYEIDLSAANAERLRGALAGFVSAARPARASRYGPGAPAPEPRNVREWAAREGLRVSGRGALPQRIVEMYLARTGQRPR
jgi:hypothetical protein